LVPFNTVVQPPAIAASETGLYIGFGVLFLVLFLGQAKKERVLKEFEAQAQHKRTV